MDIRPIVIAENLTELRSRRVRLQNTQNLNGVRTIDVTESSDGSSEVATQRAPGPQGIIQTVKNWIVDKTKRFLGFLFAKVVSFLKFNFSQIWGSIVAGYFTLKNFDWNQADSEISAQINQNNQRLVDAAAGPLGQLAGWGLMYFANMAVGAVLGAIGKATGNNSMRGASTVRGMKIPVISARVAAALAEEGGEELKGAFQGYFSQVRNTMVQNSILTGVLTARKFGLAGGSITDPNLPVDSFASKIENWIEKLPVQWQNFTEEFIEEFEDSIMEAGYVVSASLDDYYAAAKLQSQHAQEAASNQIQLRITNA